MPDTDAPQVEPLTPPWAYYRRKGLSEMRPYIAWEPLDGISVSEPDKAWLLDCQSRNADPGGYIARNPKNHADQWYVAQAYFDENLEPVTERRDDTAELIAEVERFLGKHFHGGSKANRPEYGTFVPTEDIYALRAALARVKGGER